LILRPYGIVLDGRLEVGVEAIFEGKEVREIRPHTGIPSPFVLSPAFVNHHSHLEYRGLMGAIPAREYWPWIREITRMKRTQEEEIVARDARQAAIENRACGVGAIAEHSDRPVAAEALVAAGLTGIVFQEVITFFETQGPQEKLAAIESRAESQRAHGLSVHLTPHAPYTVDEDTLRTLAAKGDPLSIHAAETPLEDAFFREGRGPIGDLHRELGLPMRTAGVGVVEYLAGLGFLRPGVQFVHACAIDDGDIETIAQGGVAVAHCPRSNRTLGCPIAPVRRMIEAQVPVGLGLDSAASSGPIDIFAEMREAVESSHRLHEPLTPEAVWRMATAPLPWSFPTTGWIAIHVADAHHTLDLIERGRPDRVEQLRLIEA